MVPWHPGKDKGAQKGLKFNFSEKGGFKKNHRSLPNSLYTTCDQNKTDQTTWLGWSHQTNQSKRTGGQISSNESDQKQS